jgi:CMP-N,N'-diacetyllegionaminic acid synthase
MREVIGIVPARGGSKGVPRKNKRLLGGKPLIAYTLEAALASSKLTRVIVTTDDADIVEIAQEHGVEAVLRPTAIAADDSPVIDAVRHALDSRGTSDLAAVVLLQPTSPFRPHGAIDAAIDLFFASDRTAVCSVCRCEDNHPARMYTIENDRLTALMPELASARRQDLPGVYHRNGCIYVFGPRELESGRIIGDDMVPLVTGGYSAVNIDTELDLLLAAAVVEHMRENPDTGA